jgi:FMN-dependent oxidoreductase (nitrilotriacetate monooxygenase family)
MEMAESGTAAGREGRIQMNTARQMHLGVYAVGTGNHVSGWRFPGAATSSEDFAIFKTIANSCERGKLDFLFVGDSLAFMPEQHPGQMLRFEPLTLHAALASQTSRVGLVATASTTYSAPFNVARMFSSLDKLSGGRAGWNVVTTSMPEAAGNFGTANPLDHATRYESAAEFVEVVQGLWDSWEEGAITANAETGEYFDKTKVHPLNHVGKFYSVRGPLNVTRTPQGQPVLVQAGASDDGKKLASRFAEMIFTSQLDKDHAKEFYETMKAQVAGWGRNPDHCKILPGFMPIVGRNEEDARKKLSELMRLAVPAVALKMLSARFGHDMSGYDLDGPMPNLPLSNEIQTHAKVAYQKACKENLTLRDFYNRMAVARGYLFACGDAAMIADVMEEWFVDHACDGFILVPPYFPVAFDEFIDQVVPELQKRGIFRREYSGSTLREHLGLTVPTNRYSKRAP